MEEIQTQEMEEAIPSNSGGRPNLSFEKTYRNRLAWFGKSESGTKARKS